MGLLLTPDCRDAHAELIGRFSVPFGGSSAINFLLLLGLIAAKR
jgi:hypothetical protein